MYYVYTRAYGAIAPEPLGCASHSYLLTEESVTDKRTNERTNEQTNERTNKQTNKQKNKQTNKQTEGRNKAAKVDFFSHFLARGRVGRGEDGRMEWKQRGKEEKEGKKLGKKGK